MNKIAGVILLLLIMQDLSAQKQAVNEYAAIDKKMLLIPVSQTGSTADIAGYVQQNFKTNKEKARAVFIWTASSIRYDLDNMFAINFYEKKEEKIAKALKNRKGICENYAAVFNDICSKAGISSFVVEGYTKQNGFTDYIPHAWCAALIDSSWRMFDPTWGSGYVSNGKFISRISNAYCMVDPAVLIKSHMPFDFLWQFLYYPVTNQEFYEGKIQQNKSKPFFAFPDSIRVHEKKDTVEQLMAVAARIEKNGIKNAMVFDRLHHIKAQLEYYAQRNKAEHENAITATYNLSIAYYNDAINNHNVFIEYRNKQFIPEKPDAGIQAMLDTVQHKLKMATEKLKETGTVDATTGLLIEQHRKAIDNAQARLNEQQEWLTLYFSKSKNKRKTMFYEKKTTWFGIPLN